MLNVLALIGVLGGSVLAVAGLLALVTWREHTRELVVARQVMLTDAIHRELGAVVAPVVEKRMFGRWQVRFAVPVERPTVVGRIVAIADDVLGGERMAAGGLRIILTPQTEMERPRFVSRMA